jgi:hypothetical protein
MSESIDVQALAEDIGRDAGHIDGAVHIPMDYVFDHADELDRSRPVVTVCRTGSRSVGPRRPGLPFTRRFSPPDKDGSSARPPAGNPTATSRAAHAGAARDPRLFVLAGLSPPRHPQ